MSRPGILVYRCRNCGALRSETHIPDVLTALTLAEMGELMPSAWGGLAVGKTALHRCDPYTYALADLIGAVADEPSE